MQSVVIVDDEQIPRMIAEQALKGKYGVRCYEDARTALSELSETRPDVLLVDLHMPDMDGYAILNAVRQLKDPSLSNIPVVIMTSDDDSNNEIKGFDLGAYDYIRKPLLPDVLIRRVDRIMKREEVLKHLEKKSEIDLLTGLLNRSACVQQINESLQMHRDSGLLFMLDLDNFKMVNDCFGHEVGDQVLGLVAEILKKLVRSDDVLGRIGGDEFVIFYRGLWSREALRERCEDICHKVKWAMEEVLGIPPEKEFGISIGIALAPQHGREFLTLYQKADDAMYRVKSEGKGGHAIYEEISEKEEGETVIQSIPDLQKRIEKQDFGSGAFVVNYNDFCNIYRFIKRAGEREHPPVQMVLFTIEEAENVDRRGVEGRMQSFGGLLSKTIRRGDVMVRCGNKQFMVLLVGAKQDNSHIAIERIMNGRSEEERKNYPIQYEVNTLIS